MVRAIGAQVNQIPRIGDPAAGGGGTTLTDPSADDVGLFVGWSETSAAPLDLGPQSISLTVNNSPTEFDATFVPNLVDFNGTNQNITFAYTAALNTAQDYTLEVLVQADVLSGELLRMFGTNGGVLVSFSGSTLQFRVSSFATADDVFSTTLSTGRLYSFMMTHNHSTGANSLYQGLALVDSGTETGDNWQTGAVGRMGGASGAYFNGKAVVRFTGGVIRTDPIQILKDTLLVQ